MILLTAAESRELDRLSQEKFGVDSYALMTHAGEACAEAVVALHPGCAQTGVLVVAGKGNNGGDGLVAGRRLLEGGISTSVVLLGWGSDLMGDAARAHDEFVGKGGTVIQAPDEADLQAALGQPPGAVIDAIFGTGLNAEVRGTAARAIELINSWRAPVIAIDIASGVSSDTGAVMGAAVRATETITFGFAKFGHVSYPGTELCGELKVVDIGFAPRAIDAIAPRGRYFEKADARPLLGARATDSHKGNYGHPMVIAGSRGKSGAAILASRAALRTGAGLVTAAVPESVQPIIASAQAELMTEPIAERDGHFDGSLAAGALKHLIEGKSAIVFGPGASMNDDTVEVLEWLMAEGAAAHRPMLIDADGLNALASIGCEKAAAARGPLVLTPHPGEMARLLKISTAAVNADRISAARTLAQRTAACVLLKGARSVVADATGGVCVNSSGNPGMATPGMGDALCGIVGALISRHMTTFDALTLGVFLHGYAADRVAARRGRVGYLAGDLIEELPSAMEALSTAESQQRGI
jgi:ADP-dependent NAD(P)H-hydrate dehydratase / NAD(P)H-hydrate epimerase